MATTTLSPTSDTTTQWTTPAAAPHYDDVVALDSAVISENDLGTGNIDQFVMGDLVVETSSISNITAYVYCYAGPGGGTITVGIYTTTQGWQTGLITPPVLGWGWRTVSKNAAYSEADINSLQIRLTANTGTKLMSVSVDHMYALITYEPPSGYAHKFLGIPSASIGKVCGIPTANVGKIKGV